MNTFLQGSTERLVVDVDVFNAGEDAFESKFFIVMPSTMRFFSVEKDTTDQAIFCSAPDDDRQLVLRCDIGNPLNAQHTAHFRAIFQLQPGDFNDTITFLANVNSTNPEVSATESDNFQRVTIQVKTKASLKLTA